MLIFKSPLQCLDVIIIKKKKSFFVSLICEKSIFSFKQKLLSRIGLEHSHSKIKIQKNKHENKPPLITKNPNENANILSSREMFKYCLVIINSLN